MPSALHAAMLTLPLCSLLLSTGCNVARGPLGGRGGAPALYREESTHNVANPNAPFSVQAGAPQLSQRPQLLDVSNVDPCSPSQLSVWESEARASGAHHSLRFTIGSTGEACRLSGFPSISLLRADGSVLGDVTLRKVSGTALAATLTDTSSANDLAAASQTAPSPSVLLPPKGEASFQLGWTTGPNCQPVSRIAIGMPGVSQAILVPRQLLLCEDELLITAVAPLGSND